MTITTLQRKLATTFNKASILPPWNLLSRHIAYEDKFRYALRPGTMPTTVKLYGSFLQAASLFIRENVALTNISAEPFCMIQRKVGYNMTTIVESPLADGTTALFACTGAALRISIVEQDGTRLPSVKFSDMDDHTLSMVAMVLLPHIIDIDMDAGSGKIFDAIQSLGMALDDAAKTGDVWLDINDIPDIAKDSAYYLDAIMCVLKDKMVIDCGSDNSDIPGELEPSYFSNPDAMAGGLICEYDGPNNWTPRFVHATGKAKRFASGKTTISEAKAQFSSYSAHRTWSPREKALIPIFPDDDPVMAETLRIAKRIIDTKDDKNAVCNIMWRGVTSFGKSTGIRQLACILNMPLLTLTCHPGMEASEFKSQFVPDSKSEELLIDMNNLKTAKAAVSEFRAKPPFFEDAMAYVASLDDEAKGKLLDAGVFFQDAAYDTDFAVERLLGKSEALDTSELCWLYSEVCAAMREAPMKARIAELEAAAPSEGKKDNRPEFVHVLSPYIKAMANGYLIEIQEASRIRDSGVLVSINEFDRPGSVIPLMNGYSAVRHKDAICIITDNVGYSSCRPIDPSVLRRQGLIIDSYELPKDVLMDRIRRNTGVTDTTLLERCYKLWETVKAYCEQNSITEGSVSPMELERFVQAVKYDGIESISYNLDDCVISKATSSIDDQRDIRTACQTVA